MFTGSIQAVLVCAVEYAVAARPTTLRLVEAALACVARVEAATPAGAPAGLGPLDAAASFTTSSVLSVPDRIRSWQVDGLKPTSS
ncbi:MAG: hypothetical protein QOD83_4028 [Solirubrobacteraceae bacterium]|nr:hypothetical protein [Solirubrobacteraceae bacterium]